MAAPIEKFDTTLRYNKMNYTLYLFCAAYWTSLFCALKRKINNTPYTIIQLMLL